MDETEVIERIKNIDGPFTVRDVLNTFGGKTLSIEQTKKIIEIIWDLTIQGSITLREIDRHYFYENIAKERKLNNK